MAWRQHAGILGRVFGSAVAILMIFAWLVSPVLSAENADAEKAAVEKAAVEKTDAEKTDAEKTDAEKPASAMNVTDATKPASGKLEQLDSALKILPDDAACFISLLRNREKIDIIRKSHAWAKMMNTPIVQMGLAVYKAQASDPSSGPGQFAAALKNPETKKMIDLLIEMGSEEVFVSADQSLSDSLELMQNVAGALRYGPLVLQLTGEAADKTPDELQAIVLMSALSENLELIDLPNILIGFKLKDTKLANEQLIKLEAMANVAFDSNDLTKGHFNKKEVAGHEYLVLDLDGSQIPWEALPLDRLKNAAVDEDDFDKLVDRLKELHLVVALGLRDDYLLVSIGSSTDFLERLGQGTPLANRPEFAPLEKFADKRLASIAYLSEDLNRLANSQSKNISQLLEFAEDLLPAAKLSEEKKESVRKDIEALAEDLKKMIPEPGAAMGFSFLTEHGIESYEYNWSEQPLVDGSKPLSLLNHVGGDPIFGLVGRQKSSVEQYDRAVKWVKVGYGYFEEIALPTLPENERDEVTTFLKDALPLLAKLDKANREMLIPALADGQMALVLDGKLKSKHFVESLPATEKAMPMVEPALVFGVSDADLLKKGCAEYREAANGLFDAVRKIEGVDLPEWVTIPEPQTVETKNGEMLTYALPEDWGLAKKIAPHFAITKDVAVVTISKAHAERLLQDTPLAVGGVLQKTDRPLAGAVWFDWAALVDTVQPWADFAVTNYVASTNASEDESSKEGEAIQAQLIMDQVHLGLDLLRVVRTASSEIYLEGNVIVAHSLIEFQDMKK
jgi:hypothetical protein